MKITHLASASQLVHCGASTILTDPWLVDGEYFGSWYHAPPYVGPVSDLKFDYIYVSHIHPDHFSKKTFRLLSRSRPVLVHNYRHKFLRRNLEELGFTVIELDDGIPYEVSEGQITIFGADNCNPQACLKLMGCGAVESAFGSTPIDSIALFQDAMHAVVNVNDAPFALASKAICEIRERVPNIELLLVGYAGAGPYPQCFSFPHGSALLQAGERKKRQFLEQALDYVKAFSPKYYMPFAGTYVLGGSLAARNPYRGMPDLRNAGEWLETHTKRHGLDCQSVQLDSLETFDLALSPGRHAARGWSSAESERYAEETLAARSYDFEGEGPPTISQFQELLARASERFFDKKKEIGFESEFLLSISLSESQDTLFDLASDQWLGIVPKGEVFKWEKYVAITVDPRLLSWLLQGPKYGHWGNAEIGSHLSFIRHPDIMERALYYCICFLHV